jgi:hypothetical protein
LKLRRILLFKNEQRKSKSLRGPKALKNVVGSGCVLDVLFFIRTNKDRERNIHKFGACKSLRDLPSSPVKQVTCPSRAGFQAMAYFAFALIHP